jgi:thiol-disulfide isomerase/thioredoxin
MERWKIAQWAVLLNSFGILLCTVVPLAGMLTIQEEPYYQWLGDYQASKLLVCEGDNCPVKVVEVSAPIQLPTVVDSVTAEDITIPLPIPQETLVEAAVDAPIGQKVGEQLPYFITKDIYGEKVDLYQLRGKVVVLNLWASWCGYCVAEFPLFQKVQSDKVKVIAVCIDEDNERVKHIKDVYSERYGTLDFTFIADGHEIQQSITQISAVPVTLFIDTRGVISNIKVGAFENYDQLNKYIGECK